MDEEHTSKSPREASGQDRKSSIMSKSQFQSLAFDMSFTSSDLKTMVHNMEQKQKELQIESLAWKKAEALGIPKLRLDKIRLLKLALLEYSSWQGSMDRDVLKQVGKTENVSECVFGLMDINGDDMLDVNEIQAAVKNKEFEEESQRLFNEKFGELLEVYSGGYDVMTKDVFNKIWSGKGLHDLLAKAVESDGMTTKSVLKLLIEVTNPRIISPATENSLDHILKRLLALEHPELGVTLPGLRHVLPTKTWLTDRLFKLLRTSWNNEKISAWDVYFGLLHFSGQNDNTKVFFLFTLFSNGSDTETLSSSDLKQVLYDSMKENGIIFDDEQIEQLVQVLMEESMAGNKNKANDVDGVTYTGMRALMEKEKGLAAAIGGSLDRWLVPPVEEKKTSKCNIPEQLTLKYMRNNRGDVICLTFLVLACVTMFFVRAVQYKDTKQANGTICWFVIIARGTGGMLDILCSLLAFSMCRPVLTLLRKYGLGEVLQIDNHTYYHKILGVSTFVCGTIHTIMHLCNIVNNLHGYELGNFARENNLTEVNVQYYTISEWLFTAKPGLFGLFPGLANPTGVGLVVVMAIMGTGAIPWIRRNGHFEIYYWTHIFYIAFWLLLILHCPVFWIWFLLPGLLFLLGKIYMALKWFSGEGKTHVVSGVLLPSKVTQLILRKKKDFHFEPGDWLFINVPIISKFEWHPFTISSAPEQSDVLTLHIRSAGGWTNKLHEYFVEESRLIEQEKLGNATKPKRSFIPRLVSRLKAISAMPSRRKKSPLVQPEVRRTSYAATITEEFGDNELALSSSDEEEQDENAKSKHLGDTFSVVFNPGHDLHNFYSNYRFLQHSPAKVLYDTGDFDDWSVAEKNKASSHLKSLSRPPTRKMIRAVTTHSKKRLPLEVFIDGPHGAPSSAIFNAEHAILVATGIGVTPFASILQSIMYKYWESKNTCPQCDHKWSKGFEQTTDFKLKKVDFIWINREQKAFEWFLQLLTQLEMEQAEHISGAEGRSSEMAKFLDIHLYITSVMPAHDFKAVALHLAMDLMHKKTKRDLITGLKTRTQSGRPNWDQFFKSIKEQDEDKGKVTVFYCGNPVLADTLLQKCNDYEFTFKKEIF